MDYFERLKNTKDRRSDSVVSYLSEAFELPTSKMGDSMKYAFENMMPIDVKYNDNTIKAAEKVKDHLISEFTSKKIPAIFEYQGSVLTNTNIKIHSDIDILTITNKFHTCGNGVKPKNPYNGDALADLKELYEACEGKVSSTYKDVDTSKSKCISVKLSDPKRKVDIVVANQYIFKEEDENNLQNCGIQIYDHNQKIRLSPDYPFHHLRSVTSKVELTNDKFAKAVRLLKTIKVDSKINLSSFEITCFCYSISNEDYNMCAGKITIIELINNYLKKFISDSDFRDNIQSPNGCERPFINFSKLGEFRKIQKEIEEILQDILLETKQVLNNTKALNYERY